MTMEHTLQVTFGTSKGRDTYGYAVVTLRENGAVMARCKGGGYDMRGTVFADWLQGAYQDRLMSIASRFSAIAWDGDRYQNLTPPARNVALYGGTFYDTPRDNKEKPHVVLDGGCGFSSIQWIAEACGLKVRTIDAGKNRDVILVTDMRAEGAA